MGNQSDKALRVLVAMPLFCYWIFGSVNLFAGYLVQRRKILSPTSSLSTSILSNLHGMGPFLFIYCIVVALLMISVFYEFANRDVWLSVPQPSMEPVSAVKAPIWPFMLRTFMELLVGILASGWTLGPRFVTIWKNRFSSSSTKCKQVTVKYPQPAYSTASYQTVCPQNSMVSIAQIPKHGRKYPPTHIYRKGRAFKTSCQSISLTGNETILWSYDFWIYFFLFFCKYFLCQSVYQTNT